MKKKAEKPHSPWDTVITIVIIVIIVSAMITFKTILKL